MSKVIEIENLSKVYDLGLVGTGTLSKDLNRTWAKLLGKPDPYASIFEVNDRTQKSSSNMVYALRDINFSVDQGEVLGIIGKNGAGKSTLLKILSQITSPSTGTIKMRGRVASLLEVGTGMHPEMTARQNIYLNGSLMGMRRHEITSKLDKIVDFAGIEKYIDTPTKRFSSGMNVRLGFAIASFLDPEILIVDEVLAVGDAEFQKKAIGKMQEVSKGEGRTVLFVSHNMSSIQNLCTSAIVMENGTVVKKASVEEGVRYYLNSNLKRNENSLRNRADRKGGKELRFTDFYVSNIHGDNLTGVNSGMDTFLCFKYEAEKELEGVVLRVELMTTFGHVITVMNNYHCAQPFERISKTGELVLRLPKIALVQGEYILNIKCFKGANLGDLTSVDEIEGAGTLTVESGDFFGTGKKPVHLKEGVFLDQEYILR